MYWSKQSRHLEKLGLEPEDAQLKLVSKKGYQPQVEILSIHKKKFAREVHTFYKFKSRKILKIMVLHRKRRMRFMMAFCFMKYRNQVMQMKVMDMISIKDSVSR